MTAAYDPADIKARFSLAAEVAKNVKLRRSGREMVGLCPFHQEKTPSFTVVEDRGFYYCHGCQAHGDVIDFIASYHNTDFPGACAILDGTKHSTVKPLPRAAAPVPTLTAAPISSSHILFDDGARIRAWNPKQERWSTYTPDRVFPYWTQAGELIGYILRIDIAATNEHAAQKIILPLRSALIDGKPEWAVWAFDQPRPLYGLPRLDADGPVFLVEGEGKADLLADIIPNPVCSWPGGTNGPAHTDFSPLKGRHVIVWADADRVGDEAAVSAAIGAELAGAETVRVITWDQAKPDGWDCGNAVAEGWDEDAVWAFVDERAVSIYLNAPEPAPAHEFDANPFTGELPGPRQWAFGRLLLKRTVSAIAAPPGTGKSTWALQLAVAFCQHVALGPFEPISTGPVWVWNNEDDVDELNRSVLAACVVANVSPSALAGRLYLNSGADRALIVAKEDRRSGEVIATPDVERVIEVINARGIKLLIVDPFSETFDVESENSNDVMKKVAKLYRAIAWATDCCVLLITHTPKGTNADRSAGDLDAIRGGGAIGGVVRSAYTMFEMSEDDAEEAGIPRDSRHLYVRMDSAKANRSLKTGKPIWWRREGVPLGNADNEYDQDIVGALVHQQFTAQAAKRQEDETAKLDRVSDEIVRVCQQWGWTSADRAESLSTVAGALDREVTKMSSRVATDLIIGQMGYSHRNGERLIMVVQEHKAGRVFRKIYVTD